MPSVPAALAPLPPEPCWQGRSTCSSQLFREGQCSHGPVVKGWCHPFWSILAVIPYFCQSSTQLCLCIPSLLPLLLFRFSHLQTSVQRMLAAHGPVLLSQITVTACLFDISQWMSGCHLKPFACRLCLCPTCYFCTAATSYHLSSMLRCCVFPPASPTPTFPLCQTNAA